MRCGTQALGALLSHVRHACPGKIERNGRCGQQQLKQPQPCFCRQPALLHLMPLHALCRDCWRLYSVGERSGPQPLTRKICRASGLSRGKGRSGGRAVQGGAPAHAHTHARRRPRCCTRRKQLTGWVHETAGSIGMRKCDSTRGAAGTLQAPALRGRRAAALYNN